MLPILDLVLCYLKVPMVNFAIVLADQIHPSATPQYIYLHANAPNNAPTSTRK
ncbi:hypothetical protein K450DRAFT_222651 [Umbelopsis ramanniana AG]|uniref:Uncharacterized protein n=1 Tax=Umbelopsis ramanniana AG TaxID=1314678 RepID=A0AAD5EHN9_UMBRA|nr:uncharacterized protein K450DRAFT_222651 [Umbelopsis ramanniana AG]KAI8583235.1 hypothetical protein K450DRAFT_222651 [Umbelopsis ramanniana AG]